MVVKEGRSMKQSGSHRLSLVVGVESLRLGEMYAIAGRGIDGGVEEDLSALEGTEKNTEEVGQAEILTVSARAMVGCLEVWMMTLAGISLAGRFLRAVSAPSVSASSLQDISSSLSQSSLLISLMQLQLKNRKVLTP